jgi:ribosomal protein S3AE
MKKIENIFFIKKIRIRKIKILAVIAFLFIASFIF